MKTTLDVNKQAETLTGEILLLGLLGRTFYKYPNHSERDWLQSLIANQVFSESPFAVDQPDVIEGLSILQTWGRAGLDDRAFEELQGDYTKLFIGTGNIIVPPWESVYFNEERLLFQEQTLEVRNWYRHFGLEAECLNHDPDDHIGLELAFLVHLAQLGLKALEQNSLTNLNQILDAQKEFLSEHLLKWGLVFCNQAIDEASTLFYKGLALILRGALMELAQQFQVALPLEVK